MVELRTIKREVSALARKNGALKAILFGSYARGTATKRSDVDLIFVEETSRRFMDRLDRYLAPLAKRLGTGVETLVYTPQELERVRGRPFIRQALKEGLVLYESGKERSRGPKMARPSRS